ncbi:MAG: glucose-6-phosphate dehydrogenase [Acidobacteria bacterium]|nr:glucose-6-phosphate dehydrogenase [Acidobacteriota bacterium]
MTKAAVDPCIFVILGASGDLTRRKLLPALLRLNAKGMAPDKLIVLGTARTADFDDAAFRADARRSLQSAGMSSEEMSHWCDECLHFLQMSKGDSDDYRRLATCIEQLEREHGTPANRAFYLALPPRAFPSAIEGLGEAGLNRSSGWTRLVIEKPFGRDLKSAQELNALVHRYYNEAQVYRIDHYLGKETVQNLLVFRFANPIFETIWNRDRVESVQITVAETVGIEGRAGYYEESGVLRDMVQNHLTQLLAVVAMEVPSAFKANAIRNEKMKVLDSISPIHPNDAVFGQYIEGMVDGIPVPAYRQEPKVRPDSQTATYAALRLEIANWRWQGVPFLLRTGKRLAKRITQIAVSFRCPPVALFRPNPCPEIQPNVLVITIQPDEGFDLSFEVKVPGDMRLQRQSLDFRYGEVFSDIPEAYETLLLDIVTGDQTLFVRADLVETSWHLYSHLLENPPGLHLYTSGTWGPSAADALIKKHGTKWLPE